MKKLAIVTLLVAVSCSRQANVGSTTTSMDASASGAASPREAVAKFMATAKAQDIQAMSHIWGSKSGPAVATIEREELEKRIIYLMRCLRHDSFAILEEMQVTGGERQFLVQVKRGTLAPTSKFVTTQGPRNRWYVRELDPEMLNSICAAR